MFVSMLLLCNFFSWYNGQRWVNEDKYRLDIYFFVVVFARIPMQLCERVWLYLCLATVQWCCCCFQPPSLNLVNQPGTPRTWRCNRCDSHDHLFDWYRQNKYASLVLNLIFLLLLKILHWWLLLFRWLQVNILFFLNRKKEHKILLYKKKAPGYIVSACALHCITLRLQRCLYLCDRVYVYTYIVYIWIYRLWYLRALSYLKCSPPDVNKGE